MGEGEVEGSQEKGKRLRKRETTSLGQKTSIHLPKWHKFLWTLEGQLLLPEQPVVHAGPISLSEGP